MLRHEISVAKRFPDQDVRVAFRLKRGTTETYPVAYYMGENGIDVPIDLTEEESHEIAEKLDLYPLEMMPEFKAELAEEVKLCFEHISNVVGLCLRGCEEDIDIDGDMLGDFLDIQEVLEVACENLGVATDLEESE